MNVSSILVSMTVSFVPDAERHAAAESFSRIPPASPNTLRDAARGPDACDARCEGKDHRQKSPQDHHDCPPDGCPRDFFEFASCIYHEILFTMPTPSRMVTS
jgi:hypothetical protein